MTEDQKTVNSTDYLQKFGYRVYNGKIEPRWKRVLNLMLFEITSTWRKSTFGKIMIIIIFVINFASLLSVATSSRTLHQAKVGEHTFRDGLHGTVAGYLSMPNSIIISNPDGFIFASDLGITIGLLLMIIFGIAGSGFFADDKSGKVIEIYLSKLQKKEYFMGKFVALFLYINMFILLPLMVICIYFVDVTGRDHLDYLDLYLGVLVYSLLCSLILGSFILTLSIFVENAHMLV